MNSWCKNLELLIKSRTSLIWIRTKEEERLERILNSSFERLKIQKYVSWDCVNGIKGLVSEEGKFTNKIVETSELCSLSQLSTPNGLLENLPSSFINPFIPLTQSQETNLFIFSLSQEKLTNFSNLSSSLVLIQINEVLDFMSNSKFLHQEFII